MENINLLENEIGHQIGGVKIKFHLPRGQTFTAQGPVLIVEQESAATWAGGG